MNSFVIQNREIGPGLPPYIIAEMSGNHNQSLDRAIDIIRAAKSAGADALKIQTYTADTMTIDHDGPGFVVDLPLWNGRKLHELYQEAYTPWDWHGAMFEEAKSIGITIFSTPFDASAVDFLESLGAPAYKIASFELTDVPLIEKCASTGKPLIISTGMGAETEIADAIDAARAAGAKSVAMLQCVSSYPAPAEEAFLRNIPELARRFDVTPGLSDHTLSNAVAIAATAVGACIIEKHFTLARADGGVDSTFSLQPAELRELVESTRAVARAVQGPHFAPKPSESKALAYRRSLYIVRDVKEGEPLTSENVRSIRPAFGLAPKNLKSIIGKRAVRNLKKGEPVSLDMIR